MRREIRSGANIRFLNCRVLSVQEHTEVIRVPVSSPQVSPSTSSSRVKFNRVGSSSSKMAIVGIRLSFSLFLCSFLPWTRFLFLFVVSDHQIDKIFYVFIAGHAFDEIFFILRLGHVIKSFLHLLDPSIRSWPASVKIIILGMH